MGERKGVIMFVLLRIQNGISTALSKRAPPSFTRLWTNQGLLGAERSSPLSKARSLEYGLVHA
jgi:hypothetical protein